MIRSYELIEPDAGLPFRLLVHHLMFVTNHWHDCIELIFVLEGSVTVYLNNEEIELCENDLYLINARQVHALQSKENNTLLVLQLPTEYLSEQLPEIEQYSFDCCSTRFSQRDQKPFDVLRIIIAKMFQEICLERAHSQLFLKSQYYELLDVLMRYFSVHEKRQDTSAEARKLERLTEIMDFIREQYASPLTLTDVAKQVYLSPTYLSKFIQQHLGMTFKQYLNLIRMNAAVKDLMTTDFTVATIALQNGFSSESSFTRLFREFYGMPPGEYRRKNGGSKKLLLSNDGWKKEYVSINHKQIFQKLSRFLEMNKEVARLPEALSVAESSEMVLIKTSKAGKKRDMSYKKLMTVSRAKELLLARIQTDLRDLQRDVGFEYLRFHDIFADELHVYDEDMDDEPIYNFTYVDMIVDFLLEIDLKPFFEIGFMPGKLASKPETLFYEESNISQPKSEEKWCGLVEAFMQHLVDRYGVKAISEWYFEIWNEPDIFLFWRESPQLFYPFYEKTFQTMRAVCPTARIGTPGIFSLPGGENDTFLKEFSTYLLAHDLRPDFISVHVYYNNQIPLNYQISLSEAQKFYISSDPTYLDKSIQHLKMIFHEFSDCEWHMTEWNSTFSHSEPTNDTAFKAPFIIKTILENQHQLDSFGYWLFSDLHGEYSAPKQEFHGGMGLVSRSGLKKPGYYAYQFLNQLGNRILAQGEGYVVTKSGTHQYQILTYHYQHFQNLYAKEGGTTSANPYDAFPEEVIKGLSLKLTHLKAGKYEIKEQVLSKECGSVYDLWDETVKEVGEGEISADLLRYLKEVAQPKQAIKQVDIQESMLIEQFLKPHETRLVEIRWLR